MILFLLFHVTLSCEACLFVVVWLVAVCTDFAICWAFVFFMMFVAVFAGLLLCGCLVVCCRFIVFGVCN